MPKITRPVFSRDSQLPSCFSATVPKAAAQQAAVAEWEGEWGRFTQQGDGRAQYTGQSMRIFGCHEGMCQVEVVCETGSGHCGGSGDLKIQEGEAAAVVLRPSIRRAAERCSLTLQLSGEGANRSVLAKTEGGDCQYFCTAGVTIQGSFPFRSKETFYGSALPACFIGDSPARMAICLDSSLAQGEAAWIKLAYEVAGLSGLSGDQARVVLGNVRTCDSSPDVAACLRTRIDSNVAELQKQRSDWIASVSKPGDPTVATRAITAIAGSYQHSFDNGDVQGEHFKSTDTLEIKSASDTSIAFKVHLEFFNGHECEAAGQAEYKHAGFFVYQTKEAAG